MTAFRRARRRFGDACRAVPAAVRCPYRKSTQNRTSGAEFGSTARKAIWIPVPTDRRQRSKSIWPI